jgi:hypothetical protein
VLSPSARAERSAGCTLRRRLDSSSALRRGQSEGHYWLGPAAALTAFLSIGGGQVLVTKWLADEQIQKVLPLAYEDTRQYAEEAVTAASDDEIRECLARYQVSTKRIGADRQSVVGASQNRELFALGWTLCGIIDHEPGARPSFKQILERSDPQKITAEEVKHFKTVELPTLKLFLSGKPSQQEYETTLREMIYSRISAKNLIVQSIGPYSLLWLSLGLYTAYRLARNAGLSY